MYRQVIGPNLQAGEVLQLLVPSGIWKMSRLLPDDLAVAASDSRLRDRTGCLITEVVFPGFAWEDHCFLTTKGLAETFGGTDTLEYAEWVGFVKKSS